MTNPTSSEIIQKGPIEIDRNFFVPPNVVDVRQLGSTDISTGEVQNADDVDEGVVQIDPGDIDYVGLPIVDTIAVISQTVKVATGGTATVDVIIEVPDYDSITDYEVRVTKI